ncbi:cupin domain-containing protein [Zhihengliuella alba]|uniref:Cupin domain-containing protein n=1 Tax=Zhihengliuella alba TaxID=547018 RepID=A0ABP7DV04_9MICC
MAFHGTVVHRDGLRAGTSGTARFVGAEHGAGVSFFWVDAEPGAGPATHRHPYTETWVVLRGEAVIRSDGEELRAEAGAIVTVPAGAHHRFRSAGPGNLEMLCIHASPEIIQDFVPDPADPA